MRLRKQNIPIIAVFLLLISALALGNLIFNIQNLDTGGESILGPGEGDVPSEVAPLVSSDGEGSIYGAIFGLFSAAVIIIIIVWAIKRKKEDESIGESILEYLTYEVISAALVIIFLVGMLYLWDSGVQDSLPRLFEFTPFFPQREATNGGVNGTSQTNGTGIPTVETVPYGFAIFLIASISLLLIIALRFAVPSLWELLTYKNRVIEEKKKKMISEISKTIEDLEAGKDFRATIFRCYSRMCRLIEKHGVSQKPYLTPREFEERATKGGIKSKHLHKITNLFEEARYSLHEVSRKQRDEAVHSLKEIKRDLEV
jgi:hypothetical protein